VHGVDPKFFGNPRPPGSRNCRRSFSLIQHASDTGNGDALVFFLFDLLHLDGEPVSQRPISERKERLRTLLSETTPPLQFSDHQIGRGRAFYEHACGLKLEGIVSKRGDAPYAPGNRGLWLKVKCLNREEFVVVGWTDPEGTRPHLGALLLAYYDPDGRLIYAGRAGTGIGHAELERLWRRLQPLATPKMPLDMPPPRDSRFGSPLILSRVHWVRPELVAEVKFLAWTEDNLLRQVATKACARTNRLRTSAFRYRTLSRHDESSRAIPARRSASRSSAAGIRNRRASQIRQAAAGRPYRAVRRHRLYHQLDRAGRALSRAAAAGDALDAGPSCRGFTTAGSILPTDAKVC
jgi:ATP-dependent DNA ligase